MGRRVWRNPLVLAKIIISLSPILGPLGPLKMGKHQRYLSHSDRNRSPQEEPRTPSSDCSGQVSFNSPRNDLVSNVSAGGRVRV